MKSPFFIIGVPRSGTTLLSVVLNNHSEIFIDKDSIGMTCIQTVRKWKRQYAFHPGQNKLELLRGLLQNSYKQRLSFLLEGERLDQSTSLEQLFSQAMGEKMRQEGQKIWGDKTPELLKFLPEMKAIFPQAKFIQLIRNPYANCKSLKERQYMNIRLAAQEWKDLNAIGLIENYISGSQNYLIIKYEDLVLSPKETVQKVCSFLGVDFREEMLNLNRASDTQSDQAYVLSSFDVQKLEGWKDSLTTKEIRKIEMITADLMSKLGYPIQLDTPEELARSLSFSRRMALKTWDIFKMIFKRNRVVMTGRNLVPMRFSLKERLSIALGKFVKLYGSQEIYHLFLQFFKNEFKFPRENRDKR